MLQVIDAFAFVFLSPSDAFFCAGLFQPRMGEVACIECDSLGDFYQELPAQTACTLCPLNTQRFVGIRAGGRNRTACLCSKGFFTESGFAGEACKLCPVGFVCDGQLTQPVRRDKNVILLGILLDTSGDRSSGAAVAGAIRLAIHDINNDTELLGARKLAFVWQDSGCDASKGLAALSQMLEQNAVDAVIGPGCSAACESTAFLTSGRGIPQISYACSSSLLSDHVKYPTFVRTTSSYTSYAPALVAFMQWAHWTVAHLVSSVLNQFALAATAFQQALERSGCSTKSISFDAKLSALDLRMLSSSRVCHPDTQSCACAATALALSATVGDHHLNCT